MGRGVRCRILGSSLESRHFVRNLDLTSTPGGAVPPAVTAVLPLATDDWLLTTGSGLSITR
jgi:hypothetical protein